MQLGKKHYRDNNYHYYHNQNASNTGKTKRATLTTPWSIYKQLASNLILR